MIKIGIDAISFYVPELYLPIKDLAIKRGIEYAKLNKGLGLEKMAIADTDEDTVSFCSNALIRLFEDNNLDPKEIGRIYLGTESALDSSKPTATYAVEMLEKKLEDKHGLRSLKNCDVLDMKFACIGAVDALHNSLDWVSNGINRKAIVIASDLSKYELDSPGEYTQGAGAVALLITKDPSILSIDSNWGIATKSENDFFKPRRSYNKSKLLNEVIEKLDLKNDKKNIRKLLESSKFWGDNNEIVEIYKEEPIFDGQYSNTCYNDRMSEALDHFNQLKPTNFLKDWDHLIFHLPYAFHGRRMIFNNWINWIKNNNKMDELIKEIGPIKEDIKTWKKLASKSNLYKDFIENKIAYGEKASTVIGNMYTASIFMSLLSMLSHCAKNNININKYRVGFISYGSGSKAKIFEGEVQADWKSKISFVKLFEKLEVRKKINIVDYEKIHKNQLQGPISKNNTRLDYKESGINDLGYRRYKFN